jgi:hypothetical protein
MSNLPGLAERFGSQPIRLLVIDELVPLHVVFQLSIQENGDVRGMTSDMRETGGIGIGQRLAACFDAVQEIANVEGRWIAPDLFDFAPGQQGG